MVRNYIRKTTRGSWSAEQIENAVSAVLDKRMTCCLSAKTYGIPPTTLMRKVKLARRLNIPESAKIRSQSNTILQKEKLQSTSTCVVKPSDTYEEEESNESEDYLLLPKEDPIDITIETVQNIKENEKENEDDVCELYGKLLAKKLRQVPEHERIEIMYEIDGLLLNKLRAFIPHNSTL